MPLIALPLALAIGCGATRTAGTEGIAKDKLAVLHVTQQYDVPMLQLSAIQFDEGDKYKISGERDFYLTPGVHHVGLDLITKIDSPLKMVPFFPLGETKLEGPKGLTTGDLQAGKTYELRGLAGTVQGMVQGEEMAITREMATK